MLNITVSVANGSAVIDLKGELVHKEGDYLIEVVHLLQESGERHIALNAAGVGMVDIDGLVALMECHAALSKGGGSLLVKRPSSQLRVALRRTGLDTVLRIVEGPEPMVRRAAVREV
jgi:anti-anti-sigma factor